MIRCPHTKYIYVYNETQDGKTYEVYKCAKCGHTQRVWIEE